MRIARSVIRSQTLCDFSPAKVCLEIDEAIHENRDPVTGHVLRGDYSSEANIVGVQATLALGS